MYGCRVAVIDSGVHVSHPHIGNVIGGINLREDGEPGDFTDRIGHGTAVAAAIHEKAPAAGLLIVKVFERSLAASIKQLIEGMDWALDNGADVINLSLGTANPKHRERLEPLISRALKNNARIVSARQMTGEASFPGCMEGVLGVDPDPAVPRNEVHFRGDYAIASPYPRPIPGVPQERNLSGVSFAVANVSGYICAQILSGREVLEVS